MNEIPDFQRLDERLAGSPIDESLFEGVPPWLVNPLMTWLHKMLESRFAYNLADRVAMRLRIEPYGSIPAVERLVDMVEPAALVIVADAVLQLHPGWNYPISESNGAKFHALVDDLDGMLLDSGSLYKVDSASHCLVRRIDRTVESAAEVAVAAAPRTAADHLRTAWLAAYGLDPDPDKVFHETIRAVEEVACPLIENKKAAKNQATLGTVIGELKNSGHKWELILPGADGARREVEPLISMLGLLWQAQVSRHGGAPKSRRQSQDEAEAALHLGILTVQWLSKGVVIKKV